MFFALSAQAETALYYTSSPSSYVGAGQTALVTSDNFRFNTIGSADSGIVFSIDNWYPDQSIESFVSYSLTFAAPSGQNLQPGDFLNAARAPSQPSTSPALEFTVGSRGNNSISGSFKVFEANFGSNFQVLSFAADFIQFDEKIQSWWNIGQIRYNSNVSIIPEPSTKALFTLGIAFVAIFLSNHQRRSYRRLSPA
jgi:hypothetical protein